MKKYFLLILISVIYIVPLWTQNSIRGRITDSETQEPIVGVSIYLADLKTGTSTDTNGSFIIRNIPPGLFLAEIRMIGYASKAEMLESRADVTWANVKISPIQLVKTPAEYHPVIITGVSGSTERMRNPVPSALQTRDHMLKHGSTNAVASITEIPGVSAVSTGNAISKPVIRGLGYNRVVVLRNNIRQEGQQWGDEHGIEIDEYEIDRIEIIKGPGSIMYGSDAMAGVINFLTPQPVSDGKIGGEFMSGYQSNGNLIGNSFMQEGSLQGVSWQFRLSQKLAGNYSTPMDGYVANTGFKEYNVSGFIGLNRRWGVSQLSFSSFNQTIGLPEGERDSLGNFLLPFALNSNTEAFQSFTSNELKGYGRSLGIPKQVIRHHRIVLSNNFFFGRSRLKLDIGIQQNNRLEFGDVLAPGEEELAMQLNTATVNAVYFFPEVKESQLTIGFNGQHQSNRNSGEEFIIPDYAMMDAGVFVFARKYSGPWFFSGGIRGDFRNLQAEGLFLDTLGVPSDSSSLTTTKFSAFNKKFFSASGAAGVSYQANKQTVFRLNISRGFRSPNMAELGSNGKHEGTFRYEAGNKALKPETSLQVDLGMTYASDHFNLEVSGFYNDIRNFIYLTKIYSVNGGDSIADPADPAPVYTFTHGHAVLFGGEIFTDLHPHPLDWLHFENSFSVVQGQLLAQPDSMSNLPFIPPFKYQSELNAHAEKQIGPFSNAYASVSMAYYFAQNNFYSAFGTETATPGYALMEAGAGTDVVSKKGKVRMRIFFSVSNLLTTKYQSHLSRLKYAPVNPATGLQGIYGQGRNFSVRVVVPFIFRR
ncbi:MAG TPA: TonB-dependent receptor [Bacteroidia bacterium]|nr:TonB-dependent receptor [Bacteroidia bacterium]